MIVRRFRVSQRFEAPSQTEVQILRSGVAFGSSRICKMMSSLWKLWRGVSATWMSARKSRGVGPVLRRANATVRDARDAARRRRPRSKPRHAHTGAQ